MSTTNGRNPHQVAWERRRDQLRLRADIGVIVVGVAVAANLFLFLINDDWLRWVSLGSAGLATIVFYFVIKVRRTLDG